LVSHIWSREEKVALGAGLISYEKMIARMEVMGDGKGQLHCLIDGLQIPVATEYAGRLLEIVWRKSESSCQTKYRFE
jgi:hypothetical protein